MAYFLGIDFGTSGCRAIVIDNAGQQLASSETPITRVIPHQLIAEQDPAIWWQALLTVLHQIKSNISLKQIAAISINGTSSTLVITDSDGKPLFPALMYNDARAIAEIDLLSVYAPKDSPVLNSTSALAKLLWLKKHCNMHKAHFIQHQADWVSAQLSGCKGISDINNCLKLGYDPIGKQWPQWLNQLPLLTIRFPKVVTPGTIIGNIANTACLALGMDKNTLVIAGTTDSTAAVIASGITQTAEAVSSLGSTLVVKVLVDKPLSNARFGIYSQPYFEQWLVGGASNTGGAVLKHFFSDTQIQSLTTSVNPQKFTGLQYYPLLTKGERFPINDPNLPPIVEPRPKDEITFFQGLLESIAYIEKQGYDRLAEIGAPYPTRIYTNGGGACNDPWMQIRQKILNVPVIKAQHTQAAYGSALLAQRGFNQIKKEEV